MEDLYQEAGLAIPAFEATALEATALEAAVPETLAEAEELAASIERAVQAETDYGIEELSVEINREGVLLRGHCGSFYCKQLAQHAAMTTPGGDRLINCIEVD